MRELQNEVISLVDELKMLSVRNDDMMVEKDVDMDTIRQLDDAAREYKRKWEKTKTELRNLKGAYGTYFGAITTADNHTLFTQQHPQCSYPNRSRMTTCLLHQMVTLPTFMSQLSSLRLTTC